MYARVATFEGSGDVDAAIEMVRNDVASDNRPPGLEDAKGFMMLVNRETGKNLGIVMFETEDALERGDAALNAMTPTGEGSRTSVEMYEIPVSVFPG
jgi:hypothetical protein